MAADRKPPAAAPQPEPETAAAEAGPPYYEAAEALYVHNPDAGVAPARAFSPGDHVPADLVEPNGWAAQVRVPAGYTPPRPAPAAAPPDTSTSKEH